MNNNGSEIKELQEIKQWNCYYTAQLFGFQQLQEPCGVKFSFNSTFPQLKANLKQAYKHYLSLLAQI